MTTAPTVADVFASVEKVRANLTAAADAVVWQVENKVWTLLDYDSWDAMLEGEYDGPACMLPPKDRPALTERLRAAGLTQRQVADTLAVSVRTVKNDDAKAKGRRGKVAPSGDREPLPERFHRVTRDLGKKVAALRKLVDDDKRFARNRRKVAQHRAELLRIRADIDHILQRLGDADAERAA